MKLSWALTPFLLMDRIGSLPAAAAAATSQMTRRRELDEVEEDVDLITDTVGFVQAVRNITAGSITGQPSVIHVAVNATIDFDDATTDVGARGLGLVSKNIEIICVGYTETRKCTVKRSTGGGRFFNGMNSVKAAFTGFQFTGGVAPDGSSSSDGHGGAFAFRSQGDVHSAVIAFTDCDFVNNAAPNSGGAVYMKKDAFSYYGIQPSFLSLIGCTFDSNTANGLKGGGAVYAASVGAEFANYNGGTLNIGIGQCAFSNNSAPSGNNNGNDIHGEKQGLGKIFLECIETTTSGTGNDVEFANDQTCSAFPSSAPSALPSNAPSTQPSVSARPSSSPSSSPSTLWEQITFDDFETDWGQFKTKGGESSSNPKRDAFRVTSVDNPDESNFIPEGNAALLIRDNEGKWSSVWHRTNHDVTDYSNLRVGFSYRPRSMDAGERFFLEYSSDGGTSWKVMKRFVRGTHFENGSDYHESVDFNSRNKAYEFTDQARIRFRCKGSGNNDFIYIDNVLFEGHLGN